MKAFLPALAGFALLLSGDVTSAHPKHKGGGADVKMKKMIVFAGGTGARLGVEITPLTDELRAHFGAGDSGVMVGRVDKDGAGAKAGVKVADIIVEVGGEKVDSAMDILSALAGKKDGEDVKVVVVRDKKRVTLTAKVDKSKSEQVFHHGGDGDFDVDIDVDGDFPHGDMGDMKVWGWGMGDDEATQKKLEKLEKRLEELEKRLPSPK